MLINIHTHFNSGLSFEILNATELSSLTSPFSAGIHPKEAETNKINQLLNLTNSPQCLAIGECGLDKVISIPMSSQQATFEKQVLLSEKLKLPLILHCVKAWNEVLAVRKDLKPQQPWIFHGFRKTAILNDVLKEGLIISIGTPILYDKKMQEIVPLIPDNRLFMETDNDPNHSIEEVYAKVAKLKNVSIENLQESIYNNFINTFSKFTTNFE